jgi:two-component system, OmpR family, sensor kinase
MTRLLPRAPDTLLGRTVLLFLGVAVLLTAINVSIVIARPPPSEAPVDAFEIARLLRGLPIAKTNAHVSVMQAPNAPTFEATRRLDRLTEIALARDLGTSTTNVRFRAADEPKRLFFLNEEMAAAYRLYGPARFETHIVGGFDAAMKLPNGEWRMASRANRDELAGWREGIIIRFVISLILMLPIAWLFARWIAQPIRSFALAAEKLGRERTVEAVKAEGPSEVRQAALALNDMQERIRRYVVERTSIVGAIAHDLRTPLSRLQFHLAGAPDAVRSRAEAEISEMEQMIVAALEFAETEVRPRIRERIDLGLLVEGAVDDLSDLGKPVVLEKSAAAIVLADPLLLKRVFVNLINNAVTYGTSAVVRISRDGESAVVEIDDEGPGMSPTDLERAFAPFYRAEASRSRSTGGIGLGLAIVRGAATAQGGDVKLANRAEGGLRATVRLPLEKTEPADTP